MARNFGEIASAITANFIAEKQFFSGQALPANNLSPAVRTNNKISHFNNPHSIYYTGQLQNPP